MNTPVIPASTRIVLDQEIPARAPWSTYVKKARPLRIVDSYGQQAVDTLFYSAADFQERYSSQDTLRAQGAAYIGTGTAIVSNEGRTMLRMTADSCGLHDTSAGACSCESNTVRFGHHTRYQQCMPGELRARGDEARPPNATSCRT